MKFEVTVWGIGSDGKNEILEQYKIDANMLNIVRENLREADYRGEISYYEIHPVSGGAENGKTD